MCSSFIISCTPRKLGSPRQRLLRAIDDWSEKPHYTFAFDHQSMNNEIGQRVLAVSKISTFDCANNVIGKCKTGCIDIAHMRIFAFRIVQFAKLAGNWHNETSLHEG